jgi:hypothetical protein
MKKLQLTRLADCLDVAYRNPHRDEGDGEPYVNLRGYHTDAEHGEVLEAEVCANSTLGSDATVYVTERGRLLTYDADTDRFYPGLLSWEVVTYPTHVGQRLRCSRRETKAEAQR